MPAATSPSAMPFTSSGWSLQKSAICSNVSEVLSTSQTAVAFGMSGIWVMDWLLSSPGRPASRAAKFFSRSGPAGSRSISSHKVRETG